MVGRIAFDHVEKIDGRACWRVTHNVRVTARQHHEIACGQLYSLSETINLQPATPLRNDVKYSALTGKTKAPRDP